jgi:hypothetical protein
MEVREGEEALFPFIEKGTIATFEQSDALP